MFKAKVRDIKWHSQIFTKNERNVALWGIQLKVDLSCILKDYYFDTPNYLKTLKIVLFSKKF